MGFSLFPRQRYSVARPVKLPISDKQQTLGTLVGKCDIRCTLHGNRTQWTIDKPGQNNIEVRGLLYFTLQFKQAGDVPLQYGAVRVDVGMSNVDPIPTVDTYAPQVPIQGPPVSRQGSDTTRTDPHISVDVLGSGGELGGLLLKEKSTEGVVESRWRFESGTPSCSTSTSVTQVEYTWTRNAQEDHTATDRHFKTAIVLSRTSPESLYLTVHVEAIPLRRNARIFHVRTPAPKRSAPIGPSRGVVEAATFEGLLQDLEQRILAANDEHAAHEVLNTLSIAVPVAPDLPATDATVVVPITAVA
ncbi:hypothetical protein LTR56_019698 [Elasticomyces elasticus]|nr:hypothetical protein LTR56_019698 [Elasticomyces elasticus]KAK3633999.1 hypothetical protein LTR22_019866 [Elasticomyces elasticus]KAK4911106.1 hypothetical protein LTR49_020273 [Elasticomyces elasticus]KAK5750666.1 hypothetical protein LTS12_019287 [Elasticomyces elasticus]